MFHLFTKRLVKTKGNPVQLEKPRTPETFRDTFCDCFHFVRPVNAESTECQLCRDLYLEKKKNDSVLPLYSQADTFLTTHQNAAQRVLDGMNYMIQTVSEYSTGPTKAVTAWLTDQVAPPYWRPNTEITVGMKTHGTVLP